MSRGGRRGLGESGAGQWEIGRAGRQPMSGGFTTATGRIRTATSDPRPVTPTDSLLHRYDI